MRPKGRWLRRRKRARRRTAGPRLALARLLSALFGLGLVLVLRFALGLGLGGGFFGLSLFRLALVRLGLLGARDRRPQDIAQAGAGIGRSEFLQRLLVFLHLARLDGQVELARL